MFNKLLLIFFLNLFPIVCVAQSNTPSGEISLVVTDQLSATVNNAKVTLVQNKKNIATSNTNQKGVATFKGLEGGNYTVLVEADGFDSYNSEEILIEKGKAISLKVQLSVATIREDVSVNEEDVRTRSDDYARVLTEEDIKKLPDDPVLFERVLREMAGPSVTGGDIPISVEGFNEGKMPPKEIIREIRFDRNVFSAQYDNPNGGGIQVFTKSEVKKFTYSFRLNYGDSKFNAANPYIFAKPPFKDLGYSSYITGPLIPAKASFTLNYIRTENRSSEAINATILDSLLTPVNFRSFFKRPGFSDDIRFTIKADLLKKHSVYFSYNLLNSRNSGNGVGGFDLSDRAFDSKTWQHDLRISHAYFANSNFVNQSRIQIRSINRDSESAKDSYSLVVQDSFLSGGAQIDELSLNNTISFFNDSILSLGKHELRFGNFIRGQVINQTSQSNFGGTYFFSGRQAPLLNDQNQPVFDLNGNVISAQISSLEAYRRTLALSALGYSAFQIRALGGGASFLTLSGGNPELSQNQVDGALYLQHSFIVNEQTLVTVGLRYENQTNIKSNFNFAPRLGIAWSPKNEKKTALQSLPVIRAGFGVFYTRFGINNFLSLKRSNSNDKVEYFVTSPTLLDIFPNVPTADQLTQFSQSRSLRSIDDSIDPIRQQFFNVVVTKKLSKKITLSGLLSVVKETEHP